MRSIPLFALALGVLADVGSPASNLCGCSVEVSSSDCSDTYLELFKCWTAAGGECRLHVENCRLDGNIRLADGCGEGGNACPSDYECRVPGNKGAGLCTPKGLGDGLNIGNINVARLPPPEASAPAPPPAAAAAAAPPRATILPVQAAPKAPAPSPAGPAAPVAPPPKQPAVPVAMQPPQPTAPPQLGPPRPVANPPPPSTVTVTGVWTPRGQNPPRPVREPPPGWVQPPQQQQPIRPPPQQQPIRPPPYAAGQPGGQGPPPGSPYQPLNAQPAGWPYPNVPVSQSPPPRNQPAKSQLGKSPLGKLGKFPLGKSPLGKSPLGKSPRGKSPRGKSPLGKSPLGKSPLGKSQQPPGNQAPAASSSGGKMPLKVGKCTERERTAARCRLADLCFQHPLKPVCVNAGTTDDCGYSRNQKLFGRRQFKECPAGQVCLADYRATDGDDGICVVEPR